MTSPSDSRRRLPTSWRLARLASAAAKPSPSDWIDAAVPGAVQLDWARAHGLPDFAYGQNVALYAGLEDSHWLYRTEVPADSRGSADRLFFTCAGVDYRCDVRLGGETILSHEGMTTPFEVDVSLAPAGTPLEILVFAAPKREGCPDDRTQASHVTKAAVSYGWDWHPRLIPLGLCEEAGFEARPRVHIRHVDFSYVLSDALDGADVTVTVETSEPGARHTWTLEDPAGKVVLEGTRPKAHLARPSLWWTHDRGEQALYTLRVRLASGDSYARRVGFRRTRLVMYEGAWGAESTMPKSRDLPPVTLELNGQRIFAKGSNWVNPDIFHGRVNRDTYKPLLELARGAHFNLMRCWGGAPAAKESFFELCDELGILVWQEFPLACNLYPDDTAYLQTLDRESRALIRRVRQHPCLCLWVGGNELFNSWSRMTDQSLPLRLLNRNCYDLDPLTPFMPTSPVEGMGHGDYRFRNQGRDVFQTFQQAKCTAYSEFGCPGAAPVDYLRRIIPQAELWPPRPGTSWETHHGLRAWEADETTWLCTAILEDYFGPSASLEELVARSNWLQCEGYKSVYEEARRQQPRCSMALSWCYNEAWPCAANNSVVSWPAEPKPAYASIRDACRPILASARIPKFQWSAGEEFSAELWLLNDTAGTAPAAQIEANLIFGNRRISIGKWDFHADCPRAAEPGPRVGAALPPSLEGEFILELVVSSHAEWSSSYRLSARPAGLPPLSHYPR